MSSLLTNSELATIETLRQVSQCLDETRAWLESGVRLDPVYAQRLRQRLAVVRELAEEAWEHELLVDE
jgi:hypothetical protein